MLFSMFCEKAYLEQTQPVSTLKHLSFRKTSFQKLNILTWKHMQEGAVSNIDGFLWRDTCVSSTQQNRPIWRKGSLSPPGNNKVAGTLPFRN
jgi:hypothetical protein